MTTLTTIGYERADLDSFIATLRASSVECVIDVRELPLSRKRGFSKTALREALVNVGIRYVHLKSLGDPKPGREAARAGRFDEFYKIYRKHLATPEAQIALAQAGATVLTAKCCLLCYEQSPEHCHRKVVAESLSHAYNVDVRHLFIANKATADDKFGTRGNRAGVGQGGATPQQTVW
jgi:uncharacterized protein (DUF488 family)